MDEQHIQVATNLRGPVRTETFQGREYVVVPAVLVKAKVLMNNLGRTYLPPEAITPGWADLVNGAPVVTDHPRGRSARTPDVLNQLGVGFTFNARAQNGALKADVYLDPARVADVPDLAVILEKLEAGEHVEGSTGFPVAIEETSGVVNGAAYDRVIHPTGFDHYATFAEQIGACSVEDGCGLAQNRAEGCGCQEAATMDDPTPPEIPEPPASHEALAEHSGWRGLIVRAARWLGLRPAQNESDEDRRQRLRSALIERFGADDRYLWIDSVFSEDNQVVFEIETPGDAAGLFRVDYEMSEDGIEFGEPVEVRRVTTFEPVANVAGEPTPEEGSAMNREQMIAKLAEAGPLDAEALNKLSDCQLKALSGAQNGAAAAEPEGDGWDKAREYREKYERLEAETRNARAAEQKERADLLDDLLYNARQLPWSEQEIRAMDIVQLRKVHKTAFPQRGTFVGRGGPAANGGGSFDFVQPIMDGPAGASVLDRKEAN